VKKQGFGPVFLCPEESGKNTGYLLKGIMIKCSAFNELIWQFF
jgi:hypothetical protein